MVTKIIPDTAKSSSVMQSINVTVGSLLASRANHFHTGNMVEATNLF